MAYRGRGRGRGRGDFGGYAAQEPYILFPDVELPDKSKVMREMTLIYRSFRLQNYWKSSPYYLEEASQTSESF
ncbi:hypothetical protein IFM89_030726 [Coptis chinensis]|uniref:Uncharacterized protein n=1 Tax=Coptis chinensis TaxID=261450 RepID=A0A835IZ15_9MAGN|nr:hypothetical protein IFM89_030726 [Coptis chinensis]